MIVRSLSRLSRLFDRESKPSRTARRVKLGVEALEDRTLLTGFISPTPPATTVSTVSAVYHLHNTGNLYQGQTLIDQGVDSIAASGNNLLDLENNSQLWLYNGDNWTRLDVGVASFQSDANGNVAILENNGVLRRYSSSTGALSLAPLASNVQSSAMTSSGTLYFLDNSGNLSQDAGGNVSSVATSVQAFGLDGAGNLYELTNGNLVENQTTSLATSVASFSVDGNGDVAYLQTGGTLVQGVFTVFAVSSFQMTPDGTVYYLTTNGTLSSLSASLPVDTGVSSFVLTGDDSLYELRQGVLLQRTNIILTPAGNTSTLTTLDRGVQSIQTANNGALYDLESNGQLWRYTLKGWSLLDNGVQTFVLPLGGSLVDLESNGQLWQLSQGAWVQLDSGASSLSLAQDGFTLNLVDGSGGQSFTGVVTTLTDDSTVLYQLLNDHSLWQFTGNRWGRIDAGVRSIAFWDNFTLVELKRNGQLRAYIGGAWEQLDTGVDFFRINGNWLYDYGSHGAHTFLLAKNGVIYELSSNGRLYEFLRGSKILLDYGVDAIGLLGNALLDLENNGELWLYYNSRWYLLAVRVVRFRPFGNGNVVFLEADGTLREYFANGTLSLHPLASNIQTFDVAPDGTLWYLDDGGNLTNATVGVVASGVQSFQFDSAGNRVELLTNGDLLENENTSLASGATSFQLDGDGVVTYLQSSGALVQGKSTVASNATSFQEAPDGTIYYLTTSGQLMTIGSSVPVDAGVSSFIVASDDTLYEMQGGALFRRNGTTRTQIDAGVQSIQATENGALYDRESNGQLWRYTVDGWSLLDNGVQTFVLPLGGSLIDLESNGQLWQLDQNGWVRLDRGASSLSLAQDRFTLNVVDAGGGQSLTGVVTSVTDGSTVLYELLNDGTLWQFANNVWTQVDNGVKQIALVDDASAFPINLVDLESNGLLWTYNSGAGGWKQRATGVTSFTVSGTTVTANGPNGSTPIPL